MASTSAQPNRKSKSTSRKPHPSRADAKESTTSSSDEGEVSDSSSRASKAVAAVHSDDSDAASDIDVPRIAQWEDDNMQEDDKPRGSPHRQDARDVNEDLSTMPFSALLKARKALDQAQVHADSESDSGSEPEEEDQSSELRRPHHSDNGDLKGRSATAFQLRKVVEKRQHKHAPVEVTSARPVTRRRAVVEVKKVVARDPRFSPLAGELSTHSFQAHYSFLSDLHNTELSTLKESLRQANKLLRSSPRELREEREEELLRLERAVKRTESAVNQDRREHVETDALKRVKKEETERRKQGKSGWWLKDSAKKDLLLRARHDDLAARGGTLAVKKAIEKRQKKVGQKEKKARPREGAKATQGEERRVDSGWPTNRKRFSSQQTHGDIGRRQDKRRKVE